MHHTTHLFRFATISLLALSACAFGKSDGDSDDNSKLTGGDDNKADAGTSVVLPPSATPKDAGADTATAEEAGPSITNGMTPPRTSDLVLWLDPEHVMLKPGSYEVATWPDRTGKTALATGNAIFEATGFGAHPAIGVSDYSAITATLTRAFASRPFSVFFVEKSTNITPVGWLFGTNDTANSGVKSSLGLQSFGSNNLELSWSMPPMSGSVFVGGSTTQVAHVYSLRRKDATIDVMVDSAHTAGSTGTTYQANGVNGAPEQIFFGGVVGEAILGDVLVYDADLSDSDMFDVKAYLKGRYSL